MSANPAKGDPVPELYPGEVAVLIATGPSLSEAQIEYIRPLHAAGVVRVFGCNDVFKICDFLDVFYACDPKWFEMNKEVFDYPCDQMWTQDVRLAAKHTNIKRVFGRSGKGLCKDKDRIHYGSNSGFQLLNLAWHFGPRLFILIGYNMDVPKGMNQHFFGKHPKGLNQSNNYRGFAPVFRQLEPADKARVINCTYPTAIDAFKQMRLPEILPPTLIDMTEDERRAHFMELKPDDPPQIPARRPVPPASVRVRRERQRRRTHIKKRAAKNAAEGEAHKPDIRRANRRPGRDGTITNAGATRDTSEITYGGPS